MRRYWWWFLAAITITLACCYGSIFAYNYLVSFPAVPDTFDEADLVGTWQAKYGTSRTDTITFKADGTYQQIFQSPLDNYYYESSWNKWYIEYAPPEMPKLYLKDMRYCTSIYYCETTGSGDTQIYYDFIDREVVRLTGEVILRITGDEDNPKGIRLWQLQIDEDDGPEFFNLIDE
jgi:hypothetical protein